MEPETVKPVLTSNLMDADEMLHRIHEESRLAAARLQTDKAKYPANLVDVERAEAMHANVLERMKPATADEAVRVDVDSTKAKFSDANGALLLTREQVQKARDAAEARYDDALKQDTSTLSAELTRVSRLFDDMARAAENLPAEREAFAPGSIEALAAEGVQDTATQNARARVKGRTLSDVVQLYENALGSSASLTSRAVLRLVEEGTSTLDTRPDATDAAALLKLQQLVADARAKRIPAWLREGQARLEKLEHDTTFSTLSGHLRQGRGVARRPGRS